MVKEIIKRYRRRLYELIGNDRYSHPSLHRIDYQLRDFLSYKEGFFIEAGANDGYRQSNTYYFEKFLNWTGILVEPIPELYIKCVNERPKSMVFNCALVPEEYSGKNISMLYSNLFSLVTGTNRLSKLDLEHARKGLQVQQDVKRIFEIDVPTRTLNSILEEVDVSEIDLLSLDVEGYELNVLKGLDLSVYRPKYILVEVWSKLEIVDYLSNFDYHELASLSYHDVLFACRERSKKALSK